MASRAAAKVDSEAELAARPWTHRFASLFRKNTGLSTVDEITEDDKDESKERTGGIIRKLRPDMIRRMDDAPKLVDPSGWISEGQSVPMMRAPTVQSTRQLAFADDANPTRMPLDRVLETARTDGRHEISPPFNPRLGYA